MNPHATILVRPDKTVSVCSWCEGEQKTATLFWENRGYEVTHGICGKHAAELKADLPKPICQEIKPAGSVGENSQSASHDNGESVGDEAKIRADFIHGINSWLVRNQDSGKRQV